MNQGPKTDILSGMPIDKIREDHAAEEQVREEQSLKSKAEFLGITASMDGQKLIALIQRYLDQRIDALVKDDPQAQAYITLLTDIGVKEKQASKAAARLVALKTKPLP